MYRLAKNSGDTLPVPQLLFSKLGLPGADDARFRVALYLISKGEGDAQEIADALRLRKNKVEQALHYWEGAGLLEQEQKVQQAVEKPAVRRRMNAREVADAATKDATLGVLMSEAQRILGGPLSPGEISTFTTLYLADKIPADLILMVTAHTVEQNIYKANYVEKTVLGWWREGIRDAAAADAYMKLLATRKERERQLAEQMGMPSAAFTLAETRSIAAWYEEYGYGPEMIEAARLAAGDKQNNVKYIGGILKKWFGKGYKTPKDVQQAEENRNVRTPSARKAVAPKDDILLNVTEHVPLKSRRAK